MSWFEEATGIDLPSLPSNPLDVLVDVFKDGYDALEDTLKDAWDDTIAEIERVGKKVLREVFRIFGITDETIILIQVTSQQLIPDKQPNSLKQAVLFAVLNNTDIANEIRLSFLSNVYLSSFRYMAYADSSYLFGYPSVTRPNNDSPYPAMMAYLQPQIDAGFFKGTGPVSLVTVQHGVVDRSKYVQQFLLAFSDYSYTTQTMHLRAQGPVPQPNPAVVYTYTGIQYLYSDTWQDFYAPVFSPALVANNQIPPEIAIPKAEYGQDIVSVVYTTEYQTGQYYLWIYNRSVGAEFTLDPIPEGGNDTLLLMPIVPIRIDKQFVNVDTNSILYKSTNTQLQKLGLDINLLTDQLETNAPADLAKIEDVFIMFSINIHSQEQGSMKALWRFFSLLAPLQLTDKAAFDAWEPASDPVANIINIKEADSFNMVIQHNYIHISTYAGTIGAVGFHTSGVIILPNSPVVTSDDPNDNESYGDIPMSRFEMRFQSAPGQITLMEVSGLFLATAIKTGLNTAKINTNFLELPAGADAKNFNIPLGWNQLLNLTMVEREVVIYESLRMVIYAQDRVELAYYETPSFANLVSIGMTIVSIVIMIGTVGNGAPISATLLEIGKRLLIQYALTLALKEILSHNLSGASRAIAIVAYAAASIYSAKGGDLSNLLDAEVLMGITSSVTGGMLVDQGIQAKRLDERVSVFNIRKEKEEKELQDKIDAITTEFLDPYGITEVLLHDYTETPDAFMKRTVGNNNPGVATKDQISQYYENALKLPGIS